MPHAECAGTRARVRTDTTDGRGQTGGRTCGTAARTPAAQLVPRGACMAVPARAAGALARQAKARARLPARRSGVGTLTTGSGLGGSGRVKPARGRGGTSVPTLLIERDSCLHRHPTAKETALGENNNKRSPNPRNNKYIQHLLPLANVWQELSGLQGSKTEHRVSKARGRRPCFHSMGKGMEQPVHSVVLSAVPRRSAKSSRQDQALQEGRLIPPAGLWRFMTLVILGHPWSSHPLTGEGNHQLEEQSAGSQLTQRHCGAPGADGTWAS